MLLTQTRPQAPSLLPSFMIPDAFNSPQKSPGVSHALVDFSRAVEKQFREPLHVDHLRTVAAKLQPDFRQKLHRSDICMLPSYKDSLPTGDERGTSIALDVGGSGLRVAWVRLCGRSRGKEHATQIVKRKDFAIDDAVRALEGRAFFAWMAKRIREALHGDRDDDNPDDDSLCADRRKPFPVGLSWSFPVDQKSRRDATLLQMGKDFRACDSLIGEDLGDLIEDACRSESLNVAVRAVVNDSAASLLSQMYVEGSTSMAVILGTGLNAAIHLPAAVMSADKLGVAPARDSASAAPAIPNVLVNTELSMFGKDVLATTPWDDVLNMSHSRPDFQPLEHLTSGRYLGEIVRLVVVDAIRTAGLFNGEIPDNFGPYALQTSTIAVLERDTSPWIFNGGATFSALHPLPSRRTYTKDGLARLRDIIMLVSDRAAAYMATAIYALWSLKRQADADARLSCSSSPSLSPSDIGGTDYISCLGSILVKYPRFQERVQEWLDRFTGSQDVDVVARPSTYSRIRLETASEGEGALIGAAVAVALGKAIDDQHRAKLP